MAILKKSTPRKTETKIVPDAKDGTLQYVEVKRPAAAGTPKQEAGSEQSEPFESESEGQLALDVFQTADEIVIVAPIAGVKKEDVAISITDEVLIIRGRRNFQFKVSQVDYFTKECFWGNFSRSVILPEAVDTSKVKASFKNGVLTVRVPKVERIKTRMVRIED